MIIGWLTQGNHSTIKPSLCSLKSGLASRSGGCHSSQPHKNALAPQQGFVAGGAAAVAACGGIVLGIRLRFHHHTPEQAAFCLAFHQPAANQRRGNDLCWTAEEGRGRGEIVEGSPDDCPDWVLRGGLAPVLAPPLGLRATIRTSYLVLCGSRIRTNASAGSTAQIPVGHCLVRPTGKDMGISTLRILRK